MIALSAQGLGTQLRHLLELLDGSLDDVYRNDGLNYRPRYTPILRALESQSSLTIKSIAASAGISHSAASQTISKMVNEGLLQQSSGRDGRERLISVTKHGHSILSKLRARWAAVQLAADELDAELSIPLSQIAAEAIDALTKRSFTARIAEKERITERANA